MPGESAEVSGGPVEHLLHEIPVTYSKDEAVGLLEESGIVGCGGAGFPTYVKWMNPKPTLLVNAAESEPGYYANKLLLKEQPLAFASLFHYLRVVFEVRDIIVAGEEVAKPYCKRLDELAGQSHWFRMAYVEPFYKYGQERALCDRVLGLKVPKGKIPPDVGVIVQNVETLYNMYKALVEDRPVTTKQFQLYGEVQPLTVYEAPIGALVTDILGIHGSDPKKFARCKVYDGGPVLADLVMESLMGSQSAVIRPTTNGILIVDPAKDRPRNKYYPDPSYEHNTDDAPWAPDRIVNIEAKIDRVRIPVKPKFCKPPHVIVKVGDHVEREQDIAVPSTEGISIGVSASIAGRVTGITEDHVEIERTEADKLGLKKVFTRG